MRVTRERTGEMLSKQLQIKINNILTRQNKDKTWRDSFSMFDGMNVTIFLWIWHIDTLKGSFFCISIKIEKNMIPIYFDSKFCFKF